MSSPKILASIIGSAVLLLVLLLVMNREKEQPNQSTSRDGVLAPRTKPKSHDFPANLPPVREDRSSRYLQELNHPSSNIQKDLEIVWLLVESFNNTLKHEGAIPMGSNRELTNALFGKNPRGIRFVDPSKSYLNANGELIDRWGSPFFFHFVEGSEVAIRSAGKDQIIWNEDDVTYGDFAGELK